MAALSNETTTQPLPVACRPAAAPDHPTGTVTIKQGNLCVDNNYRVDVDVPELAHGGPWQPGA